MTEIRAESITWTRSGTTILHSVGFTAPTGRMTGLIGPNGSGKTSLLSIVARLVRPDTGTVTIDGRPTADLHRREFARRVALVEQHSVTEWELTVEQIAELGVIPHHAGWARTATAGSTEAVRGALAAAGVSPLKDRVWQTLSGGEKQKTQLARAFAQRPDVLLLDEPTNHLDVTASLELLDVIRGRDVTILAAMHDLNLAAMYCDHLVVLRGGRVIAEGPTEQVLTEQMLAEVYGIDAIVQAHPRTGRPMAILCAPIPANHRCVR